MSELLFKFLRTNGAGLFSGFDWPLPAAGTAGDWVEARGPLDPCRRGIHVCRSRDLPYWLAPLLVEVEVDGERIEQPQKVVVRRARVTRAVAGWPQPAAKALADDCAWTVRDLAVLELELLGLPEADALRAATDLADLRLVAEEAMETEDPERPAKAALFLRCAFDAATYATTTAGADAARYTAYVAAYAADRATPAPERRLAPGVTDFAVERERQAEVLATALALAP